MTAIRRLIQTSPARANELFAKLVDTSDGAVRTRERLFSELKEELELLARLEEEHLFPVLRKHKDTKNLVADAIDDNRQTRKLLAELERTPKEREEFVAKVAELRKVFQQHVRDDKKELLPAVLKALSDEEAETIVGKIEDEKAEIEEAKRMQAEQRRAAAREEREQAENIRQAAEGLGSTVRAGAEVSQHVAQTTQDTIRSGVDAAARVMHKAVERFTVFSFISPDATRAWRNAGESLTAVMQANSALAARQQEIWREWLEFGQQAAREGMAGMSQIVWARTPQHLFDAQIELLKRETQILLDGQARISRLSADAAVAAKGYIEQAASAAKDAARESVEVVRDEARQSRRTA